MTIVVAVIASDRVPAVVAGLETGMGWVDARGFLGRSGMITDPHL